MLAELSIHWEQVNLPGSRLSLNTISHSFPPIANSGSQTETSTTASSSSTASTASTMSITLPGSILSTVTTTGSTLPTPVATFMWSNFPSAFDTCTSAMLNWQYTGPPETLQFILVSNASPHTRATSSKKRASNSTTLATYIDAAAMSWNWTQVNFDAGRYVMGAYGTDVSVTSPTFTITNGADTSCLVSYSSSSVGSSATSSVTTSSSSSTSSATALPATSSNKSKTGAIAGGVVAGIAVLLAAVAAYVYFGLCRHRRPRPGLPGRTYGHNATENSVTQNDLQSLVVAYKARTLPLTEEDVYGAYPLDNLTANPPLVPNRRPPSSLISEHNTPVSPYIPQPPTRELMAGSIMDVSTIASRSSTTLSDTPSTAGLMGSFSSCPPSYVSSPSHPPSYFTGTRTSSSAHLSYASSS